MTKRMLIDATHAEETRVVVVDGQRIEELDYESRSHKQLRGNIYLAKVTRVEPSLQAAFIEYGGNRHGFLAFNEIHPDYYQIPVADREALMREVEEEDDHHEPARDENGEPVEGGSDDHEDEMDAEVERRRRRLMRRYKIQEVIKRRQIMLVQVVKEERGNKGAALTTYLSLAGRYCVLMPNTARGGGISRKITNAADRKRLKSAVASLDVPQGMGLIIRTAGAARTKAEIKRDYDYLLRLWEQIRESTLKSIAPALIYEEEDLVKRAIRDMYDKDLDGILVEGEPGYREARDFMRMIMPSQAKKVIHYQDPTPLFVRHKVEDQLAQIHQPTVPLKSGGYLVINQTEALVAIDVNSGRATRERNIEATALKTNLEAAEESARQLRLRDLAGLIVIDFIDMDEAKNNRAVEKKLKDALQDDRARIQMGKISPFGLMEISRQRRRISVLEGATQVCEHCQGTGRVRSVESAALSALRAIEIEAARGGAGTVTLKLAPAVALYVLNEKRGYLNQVERVHGLVVTVGMDHTLGAAEHALERTSTREGGPRPLPVDEPLALLPASTEPDDDYVDEDEEEEELDEENEGGPSEARAPREDDGEGGRRGRRRRRRGRGGRRDEEGGERQASGEREEEDEEEGGREDRGEGGRRRRRRGRRGGRRMREDGGFERGPEGNAGLDQYAWVHPHPRSDALSEADDPYAWRDPLAAREARFARRQENQQPRPAQPQRDQRPAPAQAAAEPATPAPAPDPYVWTDAPPAEPELAPLADASAPKPRRSRKKAEAAPAEAAPTEAVTEATPAAEAAPAAKPRRGRAKKAEAAAEAAPAPEPVSEAAPPTPVQASAPAPKPEPVAAEPATPPEPDPNEISGKPAAARRGWWRRG
jgi:ribonuclease E